jgi:plasmid stabilization system protein ParE
MTRLEWSEQALLGLDRLRLTHSLPTDTRQRVESSAGPLARFPRFGAELREPSSSGELRFFIGPWPWLVVVYVYLESEDRVVIVSVEDGRAATATITEHRHPGA